MSNAQPVSSTEKICFITNRLIIREFSQNDLEAFLSYEKQPEMLQFESSGILPCWQHQVSESDGKNRYDEGGIFTSNPLD